MDEFRLPVYLILILLAILNAKTPNRRVAMTLTVLGILLAFLPSAVKIDLPWNLFIGMTIPLLLWQNARRLFNADWRSNYWGVLYWLTSALIFSALFSIFDLFIWPGALLFGMLVTSVIWRAGESEQESSYFGQIGPLTLIFLLLEITAAIEFPDRYFGGLFSGAALGAATALVAVYLGSKVSPNYFNWLAIGQLYFAYWLAYLFEVSSVSSTLTSLIVFIGLGLYRNFWPDGRIQPAPMNSRIGFGILLLLFMFLGWQSHLELTGGLILEVLLGCSVGLIIAWIGMQLGLPSFQHLDSPWRALLRVAIFLFPALLLWPRGMLQQPLPLAVATILALVLLVLSTKVVSYFLPSREKT